MLMSDMAMILESCIPIPIFIENEQNLVPKGRRFCERKLVNGNKTNLKYF